MPCEGLVVASQSKRDQPADTREALRAELGDVEFAARHARRRALMDHLTEEQRGVAERLAAKYEAEAAQLLKRLDGAGI